MHDADSSLRSKSASRNCATTSSGFHALRFDSNMRTDANLIQIADSALADAYVRAGDWMACKPGCHHCCIGVFAITTLDADRLRDGLAAAEPGVRERVRHRAAASR